MQTQTDKNKQTRFTVFDAAHFPIEKGVHLIEASAGTGKTYAIGMLVLRAIVERGISIDKVLIVTFTKAATEELRQRIRSRLAEARDLLTIEPEKREARADKTLLDWVNTVRNEKKARLRLQVALLDIDTSSIFTIHGFCQRMLREQALESGQLFDVELLTNIEQVRSEVADDFWRNYVYPLAPLVCNIIVDAFSSPDKLLESVLDSCRVQATIHPDVAEIDQSLQEFESSFKKLALWWQQHSGELHTRLDDAIGSKCFKKSVSKDFDSWFDEITSLLQGHSFFVPETLSLLSLEALTGELNGNKFRGLEKKQAFLAGWNLPSLEIGGFTRAIGNLLLTYRVHLAKTLGPEVTKSLENHGSMSFNDLIHKLSEALVSKRAKFLIPEISGRYSMALIDEFQDTDSHQYTIFKSLFGAGKHYLYLIGDPKQAIYKFRGADIHSYFKAKDDTDKLLTLEKNYRSHPFLVAEVNRLFDSRPQPFLYEEDILDYRSVVSAKSERDIGIFSENSSIAGMVYCSLEPHSEKTEGRPSSAAARDALLRFTVSEIVHLLSDEKQVYISLGTDKQSGEEKRRLVPSDIAILVRSNREAEAFRATLSEADVPAVVSSRQSVFKTGECLELLTLLHAITSPGNMAKMKSGMAISWFGYSGNELHELWQEEIRLNQFLGKMADYNRLWQEKSFLTMMYSLLENENVLHTIASTRFAERKIVNIWHLLELVQKQESEQFLGIDQTIGWLQKMYTADVVHEEGELLLESDEQAVRIVTMHSAKGLEYPVLFCPYLWNAADQLKYEKYQVTCHDGNHSQIVDLGSERFEEHKEIAEIEQTSEDLRLLYVALTRAQLRCYTMWADVKKHGSVKSSFESPLGYLLFPEGLCSGQQQQIFFEKLAENKSISYLQVPTEIPLGLYQRSKASKTLQSLSLSGRTLHTDYQMSSFSSLSQLSEYEYEESVENELRDNTQKIIVSGLPAGASFGNVIHDLLEDNSFSTLATREEFSQEIEKKCKRYGVEAEPGEIRRLLRLVVETELPAGFSLSRLLDSKCLKEMNFYFHLSPLATTEINRILKGEENCVPLSAREMQGYLTGFLDLVCEFDSKYYILDYKTNYLGENQNDYDPENLVRAMRAHNYGLQYWIYTLVLHNHLENVLPGYDYAQHFGGVMYLFLRGMSPGLPGNGVYFTRPDYDRLIAFDRVMGGR